MKENALRAAAFSGDPQIVADILTSKPDVNARGRDGDTALIDMWGGGLRPRDGTKVDVVAVARLLLHARADPNVADNNGNTALFSARDAAVVGMLVKAGAKINVRNKAGIPPLLYAESDEAAVALIKAGADTTVASKYGETIEKMAIARHYKLTEKLLSYRGKL